jgi:hypothetical protein
MSWRIASRPPVVIVTITKSAARRAVSWSGSTSMAKSAPAAATMRVPRSPITAAASGLMSWRTIVPARPGVRARSCKMVGDQL